MGKIVEEIAVMEEIVKEMGVMEEEEIVVMKEEEIMVMEKEEEEIVGNRFATNFKVEIVHMGIAADFLMMLRINSNKTTYATIYTNNIKIFKDTSFKLNI